MKVNAQKNLVAFSLILAAHSSVAARPSKIVQSSCLLGEATSGIVHISSLLTHLISEQEDYSDGYNAIYYFIDNNIEIGYGEKSGKSALIYAGKIYPLDSAIVMAKGRTEPSEFSPALASWSRVKDASGSFLCVGFNFDGIGRSGSLQNLKGGYLLDIGSGQHNLYYIEGNVREIFRAIPRQ